MRSKIRITIVAATLACWGLIATPAIGQELYVQSMVAPIWTAPSRGASPVCVLAQGVKVRQLKENEQWSFVRHKNRHGWMLKMRLGKLDPRSISVNDLSTHNAGEAAPGKPSISDNKSVERESRPVSTGSQDQASFVFEAELW